MSDKTILIITNKISCNNYIISWLAQCWTDSGWKVECTSDIHTKIEAQVAVLHVDLTEVPEAYKTLAKRYPVVINANNDSIGKDLFSHLSLDRQSDYKGKVIVKTIENYGGYPELAELPYIKQIFHRLVSRIATSTSVRNRFIKAQAWKQLRILDSRKYPIFDSISELPKSVWENPHLIIQKFLPEKLEDGKYMLRHWYFFGNKEFSLKLVCKNPIPKWSSMDEEEKAIASAGWLDIEVVETSDVPDKVRAIRDEMHLDYGRLDWVMHNGEPVVFDANKTPGHPASEHMDRETELGRHRYALISKFSEGLEEYV